VIHCVNHSSVMAAPILATPAKDRATLVALFVTPAQAGAQAGCEESLDPGLRRGDRGFTDNGLLLCCESFPSGGSF
jgi:hypothetical protein